MGGTKEKTGEEGFAYDRFASKEVDSKHHEEGFRGRNFQPNIERNGALFRKNRENRKDGYKNVLKEGYRGISRRYTGRM